MYTHTHIHNVWVIDFLKLFKSKSIYNVNLVLVDDDQWYYCIIEVRFCVVNNHCVYYTCISGLLFQSLCSGMVKGFSSLHVSLTFREANNSNKDNNS